MKYKLSILALSLALHLPNFQASPAEPKTRVILDTDAFNEMDDQFFLTYALLEPRFEVEGVCATQYRVTEASVDESYYEARRLLGLLGVSSKVPLFMGSDTALPDPKTPRPSPASRFIVERALAKDPRPLYILAVGALTNVASACLENSAIRERIRLIWLGGSKWPEGALTEFNAVNDRAAVKCVVEAGMDFTEIPTETCARQLTTTFAETEKQLLHRNLVGDYLVNLYRDYGHDQKVIWDMTAVACLLQQTQRKKFLTIEEVQAPLVDEATLRYSPNQKGARMKVCTGLDRAKIFSDFYARFPPIEDFDPPYVTLASSRGELQIVTVTFNEDLDPASARTLSRYRVLPDATVQSAELADPRTVRLHLRDKLNPAQTYTATCEGVRDDSPRHNTIGSRNSFKFTPRPDMRDGLNASLYTAGIDLKKLPDPQMLGRPSTVKEQILDLWLSGDRNSFIRYGFRQNFLVILEGNLEVPFDHEYEISGYVDDALRLELDGRMIFELDSAAAAARSALQIRLQKGYHPIRVTFLQRGGGYLLNLYWSFPFHDKQRIRWNYLCSSIR